MDIKYFKSLMREYRDKSVDVEKEAYYKDLMKEYELKCRRETKEE